MIFESDANLLALAEEVRNKEVRDQDQSGVQGAFDLSDPLEAVRRALRARSFS